MSRLRITAIFATAMMSAGLLLGAVAGEHAYVGTKNCRKCHLKEFKSWEQTKMAKTFDNLKPGAAAEKKKEFGFDPAKDYTTDKSCLACHATGHGAGGFVDVATTPDLVGVACEACHGPGGTYTQDGYMTLKNKEYKRAELVAVGMVEKVGEKQCVVCHNKNVHIKDYKFDFTASKEKGTHEKYPLKYKHD